MWEQRDVLISLDLSKAMKEDPCLVQCVGLRERHEWALPAEALDSPASSVPTLRNQTCTHHGWIH